MDKRNVAFSHACSGRGGLGAVSSDNIGKSRVNFIVDVLQVWQWPRI